MATDYLRTFVKNIVNARDINSQNDHVEGIFKWIDSLGYREEIKIPHCTIGEGFVSDKFTVYHNKIVIKSDIVRTIYSSQHKECDLLMCDLIGVSTRFCAICRPIAEKCLEYLRKNAAGWPKRVREYVESLDYYRFTDADYLEVLNGNVYLNCCSAGLICTFNSFYAYRHVLDRAMEITISEIRDKNRHKFAAIPGNFADVAVVLREP